MYFFLARWNVKELNNTTEDRKVKKRAKKMKNMVKKTHNGMAEINTNILVIKIS